MRFRASRSVPGPQEYCKQKLVKEMKEKLAGKCASADHAGPKDVADFDRNHEPGERDKREPCRCEMGQLQWGSGLLTRKET